MDTNYVMVAAQHFNSQIQTLSAKVKRHYDNQTLCELNYFTRCKQCAMDILSYLANGMKIPDYIIAKNHALEAIKYGRSIWYAKYEQDQLLTDIIKLVFVPEVNKQQLDNSDGAIVMAKQIESAEKNKHVERNVSINVCGKSGKFKWNGKWDDNAQLLFNNSEYLELRDNYGLPVSTFWQWVDALGLNSRLHKPLTIKTAQRTYYACHPDMFRMLVNGQHDELVKQFSANKNSMFNWYNRYLKQYYQWNGYNKPMTKIGNFTSLTFSVKKGNYTINDL